MDGRDIRREREAAGWTVAEACRELQVHSVERLPSLTSLIRMWRRWEAGSGTSRRYGRLLAELFVGSDGPKYGKPLRTSSLTVWRRWLAFELGRLREDHGLAIEDVERRCGWHGELAGIEGAQQSVTTEDLDALLPLYEVGDRRDLYHEAAANSRGLGWWQRYDERDLPSWHSLVVGLEQGASRVRVYEPQVINGLLQIPEYATAVMRRGPTAKAEEQVRRLVALRMARQAAITRDHDPLDLWVVLDEAVLRRAVDDPDVMSRQLDHVADLAQRPNITVQVLPFAAGPHGSFFGGFAILGFPWAHDAGVVYTEYRSGALYLEELHEIEEHSLAFQQLCAYALSPVESVRFIRDVAKEYANALHR